MTKPIAEIRIDILNNIIDLYIEINNNDLDNNDPVYQKIDILEQALDLLSEIA